MAYAFELGIGLDAMACTAVEQIDFEKFIVHGIGVGMDRAEHFFHDSFSKGVKASPLDALAAMIADQLFPTIGGRIQAAVVGPRGVELKPVLWVAEDGHAMGGIHGFRSGATWPRGRPQPPKHRHDHHQATGYSE